MGFGRGRGGGGDAESVEWRVGVQDGTYRVATGGKGEGQMVFASGSDIELVVPVAKQEVKVVGGPLRGETGRLSIIDVNEGVVKMDVGKEQKVFEMTDLGHWVP